MAYNQAPKTAAFFFFFSKKWVLAWQQRLLCRVANCSEPDSQSSGEDVSSVDTKWHRLL